MIALRDHLPMVELADGTLAGFDRGWLRGSLQQAAVSAGMTDWWLARDITESVIEYFRHHVADQSIRMGRITSAVREVLQELGYSEVAAHFRPGPPPVYLSLSELAESSGPCFPLLFFNLLDHQLDSLLGSKARLICLAHLRPCVKILLGAKNWRRDCQEMSDEIMAHVRLRLECSGRRGQAVFATH